MWRCILLLISVLFAAKVQAFGGGEFVFAEWLALGHYRPQLGGGHKSTIAGDEFFVAKDGRSNPESELRATIELFAQNSDNDKMCLFPARYMYLKKHGLIKTSMPKCEEFAKFRSDLSPSGVTLLFTDAYMNNPSSLFGHTLLRIDTSRKGTQLLAHGANYGAFTAGEENSVLFAIYGLAGGYYGGWTVKPYYDVINTYNNIENRDIWEFTLDFSQEELDFFVAHLWEVGHARTPYYFFSRNCSYMIMEVLDAVRPSLQLADKFPIHAIPIDTVKAVYRSGNIVKGINYRPSRQAKIVHRATQMNSKQKNAFFQAVKNDDYALAELPEDEKADVIETAYQYVQYQFVRKEFDIKEYRRKSFQGLAARNKLQNQKAKMSENPQGQSPLESHESMRITLGAGRRNGEMFQEISYRPAYHSLTDNDYGLLSGAEINFLNSRWRHYDKSKKNVLSEFNILGIRSLAPMNKMFAPISFNINLDIFRKLNPENDKEGYVGEFNVGSAAVVELLKNWQMFIFSGLETAYGGFLPHNQYIGVNVGGGSYLNFRYFKLLAEIQQTYGTTWIANKTLYSLEGNVPLTTNLGLAAEYKYKNYRKGKSDKEFLLSIRHYF